MGVQGLTAFVDSNSRRLLKDYALHDTRVLIDGNNLYHFLYYLYRVRHERAGDYDVYRASCKSFFDALRVCAVRPYVVFDGAHHEDNRKFKTSLRRAQERLHLGGFLSVGNRAKILPILTYETFRNVLNELGVEHVTCYLEADEEIGSLAQRWNCPVITNDSDFFVYDLPGGVISLDYLNVAVEELKEGGAFISGEAGNKNPTKRYCIRAQIFFLDTLIRFFKFEERSQVALAATLIGNDVVGKHNFEPFYAKAQMMKPIIGAQQSPPPGAFAAKIFDWVVSTSGVSDAIERVLKWLPEDRRDRVRELIAQSIDSYSNLSCSIGDYFEQVESRLDTNPICNAVVPLSFGGNELPFWFLDRIRSGSIAVRALNAVTRRRVILLTQVEVMSELSAYECSTRLRACFYSILLTVDQSVGGDTASLRVQEHSRLQKTLKCYVIPFVERFATGIPVPSLTLVPKLSDDERLLILSAALSPSVSKLKQEQMQGFPPSVQLLILTIVHWTLHANPKVSDLHVKALLVCCVSLGGLDDYILTTTSKRKTTDDKDDSEINSKDLPTEFVEPVNDSNELERVKTELTLKYSGNPTINGSSVFDGRIVHAFCQYQSCLQGTIYLAQLLMLPSYSPLDPARTINGTFLYNFLLELRARSNPDLYVEQLMGGRDSPLAVTIKQLFGVVYAIQPCEAMLGATGRGVRRTRGKKVKSEGDKKLEVLANDGEGEDEGVRTESVSYDVDVTNKFSCLDLID